MNSVWLIGAGPMAEVYYTVLADLEQDITIIGRSAERAESLSKKIGHPVISGGLSKVLIDNPELPDTAIVAVGVEVLAETCRELIKYGVKKILVEKPAGLNIEEINSVNEMANNAGSEVFVAYNRRFYAAVEKAAKIIEEDKGAVSFNFEFTEWSNKIEPLKKADGVKEQWLLGNSTHVIDLAFFLGGEPKDMVCYNGGENELYWHPSASRYSGAGVSEKDALFSYHADWCAPGRWSVEILTKEHKLIFRPMERLQIQKIDTVAVTEVNGVDYTYDEKYKPGLFKQVEAFLDLNLSKSLCTLGEHMKKLEFYKKISGKKNF